MHVIAKLKDSEGLDLQVENHLPLLIKYMGRLGYNIKKE
jgi:hypothetical protein